MVPSPRPNFDDDSHLTLVFSGDGVVPRKKIEGIFGVVGFTF